MKRIFVHSGLFHGDDVFAAAAAKLIWIWAKIFRVRELPEDFDKNDIALDIGGEYCPEDNVFDHHFKSGNSDDRAALGKFWKHYSIFVIEKVLGSNNFLKEELLIIADKVYNELLASIDRADIGVLDWAPISEDMKHLSASAFISSMNVDAWDEKSQYENFITAVAAAQQAIIGRIHQAARWLEMKNIVDDAERHNPFLIQLAQGGPWQEHLLNNSEYDKVLFVIFPSDRGGYCIQTIPDKLGSFGNRKPFPKRLAGLRGQELSDAVDGLKCPTASSVFVHPGRFIGGAETINDVLKLANYAILEDNLED